MLKVLKQMDIDWSYVKENVLYGDFYWADITYNGLYNYSFENYEDRDKIRKLYFMKDEVLNHQKNNEKFFNKK